MTTDTSERGLERLIGADRVTLAQAGTRRPGAASEHRTPRGG